MAYPRKRATENKDKFSRNLKLEKSLSSDKKPVKVGDDSTGLLLKDNKVLVEEHPSEEKEVATKKYVDDLVERRFHITTGGYKTNNNSSTIYYFQYRPNSDNWSNFDSTPTSIYASDTPACLFLAPYPGKILNIRASGYTSDTGSSDEFKFYVFKGTLTGGSTSTSLSQIAETTAMSAAASRVFLIDDDITGLNTFSRGDGLWVMYKKESTSGNQDIFFNITISGIYTDG